MPDFHGFGQINTIPNKRTTLDTLSYEKKMCLSEGDFRPCYFEEVLPSDIFHLKDSFVIKNIPTPYRPVIDDAYLDINYFFVPRRLLWKHWEPFIGADATPDAYSDPTDYTEPVAKLKHASGAPSFLVQGNSIANDLGLPIMGYTASEIDVSPFGFAGIALIWNEFYRDENLQDENPLPGIVYNLANGGTLNMDTTSYPWLLTNNQVLYNSVNKYHDLFTSCLPAPQKGDPVTLPLGTTAPLSATQNGQVFLWNVGTGTMAAGSALVNRYQIDGGEYGAAGVTVADAQGNPVNGSLMINSETLTSMGAVADLSRATAADINSLRLAFAAQAYLEALARGGSRYTELLHAMFGISPSDARLQRPEFLGTIHYKITQTPVASTNGQRALDQGDYKPTDNTTRATGSLGAYTSGGDSQSVFVKQFEEHGYVIGIASIRVQHTYGQGIPKIFLKKDRFDYFNKFFDRIGNVPVSSKEIHYAGTGSFGFQEAWYENKYHANEVSGSIAPGQGSTVDLRSWTYADNYNSAPFLDETWIREDRSRIDQTLIGNESIPQFVLDIFHSVKATRPFSLNSVPAGIGF